MELSYLTMLYIDMRAEHDTGNFCATFTNVFSEREVTFTFAICYRPPVCLSVVCLSITLVQPTQAVEIFGNISTAFGTLAIR